MNFYKKSIRKTALIFISVFLMILNVEMASPKVVEAADEVQTIINKSNFSDYFQTKGFVHTDKTKDPQPVPVTYNSSTGELVLTQDAHERVGMATLNTRMSANNDFTIKGKVYIGNSENISGNYPSRVGADGIGFAFHPHAIGATGFPGAAMGIAGLTNSFGFKLDTFKNDASVPKNSANPKDQYDLGWNSDAGKNFGAFMTTNSTNGYGTDVRSSIKYFNAKAAYGKYVDIKFEYKAANPENGNKNIVTVTYAGGENNSNITWSYEYTGTDSFAFAITASTGGYKNEHKFLFEEMTFTSVKKLSFTKQWDDYNNTYLTRPAAENMRFNLYQKIGNGATTLYKSSVTPMIESTTTNTTSYYFDELPAVIDGKNVTYTVEEIVPTGYTVSPTTPVGDGGTITNRLTHSTLIEIPVKKIWVDNNNVDKARPTSIVVTLHRNGESSAYKSLELTGDLTAAQWSGKFEKLLQKDINGNTINYTIKENGVPYYTTTLNQETKTITNTLNKALINIPVSKVWNDNNNALNVRPNSVVVELLLGGNVVDQVTLNEGNQWKHTFLNKVAEGFIGSSAKYSIREREVNGYEAIYTGSLTSGFVVTNSIDDTDFVNLSLTKIWDDYNNAYQTRPSDVVFEVLRNGILFDTVTVSSSDLSSNSWTVSKTYLKSDSSGQDYVYTVREKAIAGYTPSINGTTITNSLTNSVIIDVSVIKEWKDYENKYETRPNTLEVTLYRNGVKVGETQTLNSANGWTYTFEDLLKKDLNGVDYVYSIVEGDVLGYTQNADIISESEGVKTITLTNTLNSTLTSISGNKIWDDFNNIYGTRPETIKVNLLKDGVVFKSVILDTATQSTYSFTDLLKYHNDGTLIEYTISEDTVIGYTSKVEGTVITNTLTDKELIDISGSKVWVDEENKYQIRPDSILVELYQEGNSEPLRTLTVTKDTNWEFKFVGLLKNDANGNEIKYSFKEKEVPGYTTSIVGKLITNVITQRTRTEVTVTKAWDDFNNAYDTRPESLEFVLYRSTDPNVLGSEYARMSTTELAGWTVRFADLLTQDANGNEFFYQVREAHTQGYDASVEAQDGGYKVTNTLENKELVEINGTKTWDDSNNAYLTRPESITVNLLQNGTKINDVLVNAASNWKYEFTQLLKYDINGNEYIYTIEEVDVEGYTSEVNESGINNVLIDGDLTEIEVTKAWKDFDNKFATRPEAVVIDLYRNGTVIRTVVLNESNDWSGVFDKLIINNPEGVAYKYTVKERDVVGYLSDVDGTTITNTLENQEKTEFTVEKQWNDLDNKYGTRPNLVNVTLLRNGKDVETISLSETNNWKHTFTDLLKTDVNGVDYTYTVVEKVVPQGYEVSVEGGIITNTLINQDLTDVSGEKVWEDHDNKFNTRPESITVNLLQNGKVIKSVVVSEATNWTYSFEDLLVTDIDGTDFTYTVEEEAVDNYLSEVDGTTITNTLEYGDLKDLEVTKSWVDFDNKYETRSEFITVELYENGVKVDEVNLSEANSWNHKFEDLRILDNDGKTIAYTVVEKDVVGYTGIVEEGLITNTLIHQDKTDFTVEKLWDDFNNKFETRPDSIAVDLYRNGVLIESTELTEDNAWTYTFTDLLKYDVNSSLYKYTVVEKVVPQGYEVSVEGGIITNTLINQDLTDLSGEKVWVDHDNKFNTRPESITVNLLQNGKVIKSVVVDSSSNWTYSFEDLLVTDIDGTDFTYTVEEEAVDNYLTEVKGTTITNTLEYGELRTFDVIKVWDDFDNEYQTRPESITVEFYQNGELVSTILLNESNEWKHTFTDLRTLDNNGEEIVYTIKELDVLGYESSIEAGTITNILSFSELVLVEGTKTWFDNNDFMNLRPDSITVDLLRNGVVIDTVEVNASTNWKYSFGEQIYRDINGDEYEYTVYEHPVENYITEYNGFDILNLIAVTESEVLPETGVASNNNSLVIAALGLVLILISRRKKSA